MNDFTKEELEAILEALTIIDRDTDIKPQIYWGDSLPEKICHMIENYREPSEYTRIGDTVYLKVNLPFVQSTKLVTGLSETKDDIKENK